MDFLNQVPFVVGFIGFNCFMSDVSDNITIVFIPNVNVTYEIDKNNDK